MKNFLLLTLIFFTAIPIFAQTNYQWNATLKAIDEAGQPVPEARADIGYYTNSQPADALGLTDTNGIFTVSHSVLSSLAEVSLQVEKSGYYTTKRVHVLGPDYDQAKWTFTETLGLKKVGNPIAMYAKSVNLGMPVFDKPAGFDFMVGDWVGPYGKGVNADIIFTAHLDKRSESDADYKLTVSFPKAGDGIQEFTVPDAEKGSGLRSSHETPANGFQPQWVQTRNRKPGQPETGNLDANRNYIFRVRTALDQQGNVVSAHYGKIYGDFMQFSYYLNPTPNDRNIEFDPKQNLLGGIQSFEQVQSP